MGFRSSASESVSVVVDPATALCTNFMGFGVQWSPYPWFDISEAAWQRVFARLDFMRVPLVRVMDRAYHYCDGFDAQGKPIYAWENNHMKKLYRLLDYCEKNHVQVVIGEWDDPAAPGDRADINSDRLQPYHIGCTDPRWSQLVGDFLDQLINKKHYTCLKYYNLINEPNGDWSHCADFNKWKAAIQNLHAELEKRGLNRYIQITGPDVTWVRDYYWIDRAVLECSASLGAYDAHEYVASEDLEAGYMEKVLAMKREYINRYDPNGSKKPFFMGEIGMNRRGPVEPQGGEDSHPKVYEPIYGVWMTDYCIQAARAGLAGAIAWDLDDAMHIYSDEGTGWPDMHQTLFKKWGFFNSLAEEIGHPEDANLRPWYFPWSVMARSFPGGCETLKMSDSNLPGVRTLAAKTATGDYSIAMVNDSDRPCELRVIIPKWQRGKDFLEYDFSANRQQKDPNGFPAPTRLHRAANFAAGMKCELDKRSVVIITSIR